MLDTIRHYATPRTLEQTIGTVYLLFAYTLILRPFMAGLMNLQMAFGLPPLTVQFAGSYIAVAGGILIYKRRIKRDTLWQKIGCVLLFIPMPLYALSLSIFYVQTPGIGSAGSIAFWCLSYAVGHMYGKRATQRELGVGEFA